MICPWIWGCWHTQLILTLSGKDQYWKPNAVQERDDFLVALLDVRGPWKPGRLSWQS